MPLFGLSHLIVLALIPLSAALCVWGARWAPNGIAWGLAALLVVERLVVLAWMARAGNWSWEVSLPMHLCDWAVFAAVLALLFQWRLAYVLIYFWGLAGTLQALLTPDLAYDFPDFRFIAFFASHGTILVSVLFLTFATPLRPVARDVWVAFGWTNFYAAVAAAINLSTGANYGYLCAKPGQASLLDYLGPWPIYLLSLEVLALVAFWLCYAPFAWQDFLAKERQA